MQAKLILTNGIRPVFISPCGNFMNMVMVKTRYPGVFPDHVLILEIQTPCASINKNNKHFSMAIRKLFTGV